MADAVDPGLVSFVPCYRVGVSPPEYSSLAPGELFVEVAPAVGGVPRLWVGTPHEAGFAGNVALMLSSTPKPSPSTIEIDAIDNPSPSDAVHIVGLVSPGVAVEIAVLTQTGDTFDAITSWSPWDASDGTFDVTWSVQPGDNYFVRVRMQDDPGTYADSNLFAAAPHTYVAGGG